MRAFAMALLFSVLATSASAQGPPVVSVRAFRDADGTFASPFSSSTGVGVSAGIEVTRHMSLLIDLDAPRSHSFSSTSDYFDAVKGHQFVKSTTVARSPAVNALVGFRAFADRRVGFGLTGGLSWLSHRQAVDLEIDSLSANGAVTGVSTLSQSTTKTWVGIAAGAELPIRVTDHLSVVPEARWLWFPISDQQEASITRTGVNVRWRF